MKLLFGFVLSFAPYGREQAYRVTVSAFAKTLNQDPGSDDRFIDSLFKNALAEVERVPPAGTSGLSDFGERVAKNPQLPIVREALLRLVAADRTLLLLRDQCHLPFARIAAITGSNEKDARSSCLAARERLRDAVAGLLNAGGVRRAL